MNDRYIKITNKKTIAVHVNQFSIRGSEIAIYDYACYISTLLKCNVAIVIPKNHKEHVHPNTGLTYDKDIENKFLKSFDVTALSNECSKRALFLYLINCLGFAKLNLLLCPEASIIK